MTTVENTDSLSRNATTDQSIINMPVACLGISIPHLVRPLDEQYIADSSDR